jgi:hypothetical protein
MTVNATEISFEYLHQWYHYNITEFNGTAVALQRPANGLTPYSVNARKSSKNVRLIA